MPILKMILATEYPELDTFIHQVGLTVAESKNDLSFVYQFIRLWQEI